MEIPHGLGIAMQWAGILLIVFAFADFGLSVAGIDITGVGWSPIAAGIAGSLLLKFGGGEED